MTKKLFKMEQSDYNSMVNVMTEARKRPLIMLHIQPGPLSVQEIANYEWEKLGKKLGFKHMTVRPGPSHLEFYAEPTEEEAV